LKFGRERKAHDKKAVVVATKGHHEQRILAGACEIAVARLKAFYHGYQIESQASLIDASVRAGFKGTLLELRGVVVAHHQNSYVRDFLPDSAGGFKAASIGHADIQKNQIGAQFAGLLESLRGVGGFATNLPTSLLRKEISDSAANHMMIICNEDSHLLAESPED
jgi:hypothetical protein